MKKKTNIIIVIILSSIFVYFLGRFHFSATYILGREMSLNKISKIDCAFWKHNGGTIDSISEDFLEFNETYHFIKNDTLYINKKPVAIASRLVHRCFLDYELTLISFDKKQTLYYVSK